MKDNDNKLNVVGDVLALKAKVLSYGGYCPIRGHAYNLQLLSNSGSNLSPAHIYISNIDSLLDKAPTSTASALRPFKAGDIAKCVDVHKRKPACGIDGVYVRLDGEIVTVITNEVDRENGTVDIKFPCGTVATIDPVYLELLIPVEELKPYYVVHNTAENAFEICRTTDGKALSRMCYFYKKGIHEGDESNCYAELTETEAEKAAKDECKRLNEDWSKRLQQRNK